MVSRTFFTADINAAFDDMEEGNEDALKVRRLSPFKPYTQNPNNIAQNTIIVSRTAFFIANINAAFADMEEGNEDAFKVRCPFIS